MSKIKLPEKCGWFYILKLRHNDIWGFGITKSFRIKNYLQKRYINPSANKNQVFDNLYYGKLSEIKSLEKHLKNEWSDKLLVLFTDKLEWFDPVHNIDGPQIVDFIEKRIKSNYSQIYRVKTEYLPFSPKHTFATINEDPEKFLEQL